MSQRVTIVINDEIMIKLRNLQAKKIKESHQFVSFSKLLNELLISGLKKQ
jgi:hypothetical protein